MNNLPAIRQRLFGDHHDPFGIVAPKPVEQPPAPKKKLRDLIFEDAEKRAADDGDDPKHLPSSFISLDDTDKNINRFVPTPPIDVAPHMEEYDRLALVLHASLERKKIRRRYHEYGDTFWGKHAVDWLVGTQVFPDATDARNALRHLLMRRLIVRADHTKPLFNDALERIAPKAALTRRIDLERRYASPARGFNDNHLYRFPPEAYSKVQLNVRVVRAKNLKYRTRLHLGTFVFSAKFRDRRIDPYCLLEYGHQTVKTDTWSDATKSDDPSWESEFSFPVESNSLSADLQMKDLWIRVFDFHEVLDDMEIGFCLLSAAEITKNCSDNRVWVAWHSLRPASELSTNDRTYGEIELMVSVTPFTAFHPLWTVHKEARPKEFSSNMEMDLTGDEECGLISTTLANVGGFMRDVGDQVNTLVDKTIPGEKDSCSLGEHGSDLDKSACQSRRFVLQIYRCQIAPNVADMRKDSVVWVEYTVTSPSLATSYKSKSENKTWPTRDIGRTQIRGLTLDDLKNAAGTSVAVKVYNKAAGLTLKIGEAVAPLAAFLPDLDAPVDVDDLSEIDWKARARSEKLVLKRTAAFRRNRKRIVGEVHIKATVEPDTNTAEVEDIGGGQFQDELDTNHGSMIVEEELANVVSMLADNGFSAPAPLDHPILTEKISDCTLEALFWYILSRNSPVLTTFAAKRSFKDLSQGDWKWGGRDRKGSYLEEDQDVMVAAAAERGIVSFTAEGSRASLDGDDASRRGSIGGADEAGGGDAERLPPPLVREDSIKTLERNAATGLPVLPSIEEVDKILTDVPAAPRQQAGSVTGETSPTTITPPPSSQMWKSEADLRVKDTPQASGTPETTTRISTSSGGEERASQSPTRKALAKHTGESSNAVNADDCPSRVVTYKRPPEFPVGELNVKEVWKLKGFGADRGFWLEIEGTTDEATYGKQMSTIVQIVGIADPNNSCTLSISMKLNWFPRPMSAGLVERQAYPATTKTYQLYTKILKSAMKKKKAGAKGEEVAEEEEAVAETAPPMRARLRMLIYLLYSVVFAIVIGAGLFVLYKDNMKLDLIDKCRDYLLSANDEDN